MRTSVLTPASSPPPLSGSVSGSSSASQMASGVSLVSFNSRGVEGLHQRSYSVSSADQWTDATVIANSGVSTGGRPTASSEPLSPTAELCERAHHACVGLMDLKWQGSFWGPNTPQETDSCQAGCVAVTMSLTGSSVVGLQSSLNNV